MAPDGDAGSRSRANALASLAPSAANAITGTDPALCAGADLVPLARSHAALLHAAQAEADKKAAAAGNKAEQERAARLALAKRSVTRTSVCVPRFDAALSKIPLMPQGEEGEVNQAEAWWNSTMPRPRDPTTNNTTLFKEGDHTPRDEHVKLIEKYHGKAVPSGFRGLWDEIPAPDRLDADIPHKAERFARALKVHKYDTEEEKRRKQKAYDNLSLGEQRAFDRAQSAASKRSEQDEAEAVTMDPDRACCASMRTTFPLS